MSSYKQKISKFIDLLKKSELNDKTREIIYKMLEECKIDITQEQNNDLTKMSVAQLKEICKSKSLPVSGKKQDLIRRINDMPDTNKTMELFNKKEKAIISNTKQKIARAPVIKVEVDSEDDIVEEKTGFVFNEERKVVGKKTAAGLEKISAADIDVCNEMKLGYNLPENLDDIFEDIEDENIEKYEYKFDQDEAQFMEGLEEDDDEQIQSDEDEF